MENTVAIVIPLYKSSLTALEEISLQQCFRVLSKHKIIAIKPENVDLKGYHFKFDEVIDFDPSFFKDVAGYNKLMLSPLFYEKFLQYQYILIYQPDAFVFKDDLLSWCSRGYDYIGAPWLMASEYPDMIKKIKNKTRQYLHIKKNKKQPDSDWPTDIQFENKVGNGGLSLRNTKKCADICRSHQQQIDFYNSKDIHYYNEDTFWGLEVNRHKKLLQIPEYKTAVHFSMENSLEHAFRLTKGELPFGCHAWDRHLDFWEPIFKKNGVNIPKEV